LDGYSKKQIGEKGEYYAELYLRKQLYNIAARNFRCRFGEIDIIAQTKDIIAFVEVKTRNTCTPVLPADSVNKAKQKKIMKSAYCYLYINKIKKQPRFDIIEVFVNRATLRCISVNHIENAFIQTDNYSAY